MEMDEIKRMLDNHEERISKHGQEIDDHAHRLTALETIDKFRADQMTRIEGKLDKQSGKMDSLSVQVSQIQSAPSKEKADKWDKVTWYVITAVLGAVVGAVLAHVGLGDWRSEWKRKRPSRPPRFPSTRCLAPTGCPAPSTSR